MDFGIVEWRGDAVGQIAELWAAALPQEPIDDADLADVFGPDPGHVVATSDGLAVVAMVTRQTATSLRGHVRLLLVHPDVRRRGRGRALLQAAENRLAAQGAESIHLGGEAPIYLWPGVDTANLGALALASRAGYADFGCAVNLRMATDNYRHAPPEDIAVSMVPASDTARGDAVRDLVARTWPAWSVEVDRGLDRGTVAAACTDAGVAVGFCAHSTIRSGWLGPLGTDPAAESAGIASATVSEVLRDMGNRGLSTAEVAWVGIPGWFADRGAVLARTFRRCRKRLP